MVDATSKKKKSPVWEFCFYYFGTLSLLYFLDQTDVLYKGRRAFELFPPNVRAWLLIEPILSGDPLMREKIIFVVCGLALVYPMHLWRTFVKSLFVPLATRVSGLNPKTTKYEKYLEQAWLAVHYTISTSLVIIAIRDSSNFWPPMMTKQTQEAVVLSKVQIEEHHSNFYVRIAYMLQFTFYFMELSTLVLSAKSRSRSDAFVYAIHHVLTVFLIGFSFLYNGQHVGILVLIFHDIGDIFLPIAKCFVYTEDHAKANYSRTTFRIVEGLGITFFILFLVFFAVPRLILFPTLIYTLVYKAAWCARDFDPLRDGADVNMQEYKDYHFDMEYRAAARTYLVGGLILLFPLHVYWFRLALRVAYRALFGIYDDERSDDEDEAPSKKRN